MADNPLNMHAYLEDEFDVENDGMRDRPQAGGYNFALRKP